MKLASVKLIGKGLAKSIYRVVMCFIIDYVRGHMEVCDVSAAAKNEPACDTCGSSAQDEGVADLNMSCNRMQWCVVDHHCCRHDSPSVCLPLQRNEGWDVAVPMTGQHDDRDSFGMDLLDTRVSITARRYCRCVRGCWPSCQSLVV